MTHRQTRKPNHSDEIRAITASPTRSGLGWWAVALGAAALAGAMLLSQPAMAGSHGADSAHGDTGHGDHGQAHHGGEQADELADNPAVQAYREANDRMHEDMMVGFTGDADVDFARGMIPHHQGAIDMANIVLEHGEDEEIRQLAEDVIAAQEEEIAFLRDWLETHGHDVD
ncbi:CopM family metallochaperone [Halomonas sp. MA07-2]|uniref:CopM family metallochaperone n=1 Tax=unclassified Halomonas TaxID=2609666 RepID=UPI003EEA7C62